MPERGEPAGTDGTTTLKVIEGVGANDSRHPETRNLTPHLRSDRETQIARKIWEGKIET